MRPEGTRSCTEGPFLALPLALAAFESGFDCDAGAEGGRAEEIEAIGAKAEGIGREGRRDEAEGAAGVLFEGSTRGIAVEVEGLAFEREEVKEGIAAIARPDCIGSGVGKRMC